MKNLLHLTFFILLVAVNLALAAEPAPLAQEPNTWVKRSPIQGGPLSPGMGYEAALAYDSLHKVVIRWGGHNQGGGGEQNAETWVFDPATAKWTLKEPNTSPPGVCCAQQNVFDPVQNRYVRFRSFSGSHGWHWFRELYLSNSQVWNYDLASNTWRDMRPVPAPLTSPLRCASWDSDHQVVVLFGGEGNQEGTVVYDPYTNTWTKMNPKLQPAFRSSGNMAYDSARKLHILFGSQFSNDPHTWAYDLRKNEWKDMKPERQPPTDRNDAVLAYDSVNQVVIASVRAIDKDDGKEILAGHYETWAYDAGKNIWTPLKPATEPPGWANRRRIMVYMPDFNLTLMENYVNPSQRVPGVDREQQMWTYRYAGAKPDLRPQPPRGLEVLYLSKGAEVKKVYGDAFVEWKPSISDNVKEHRLFGGAGDKPWLVNFGAYQGSFVQKNASDVFSIKPGKVNHFYVTAIDANGKQNNSVKIRTQPRLVEDAVASVLSSKEIQLYWKAPPNRDNIGIGYHIERAVVEVFSEDQIVRLKKDTPPLAEPSVGGIKAIGKFTRLTKEPVYETKYVDKDVDLTKPQAIEGEVLLTHRFGKDQIDQAGKSYGYAVYAYRIRAVNELGVEGGDSPYFLTIPSAPQQLFSKEDGDDCQLKWQANPEQKLKGYRVYRMESPRINGAGQKVTRLTADPMNETRFTDVKIGKDARRYWIVAVDALGQEGIPSAPTWHYREYRRYYVPFVGEWHQ